MVVVVWLVVVMVMVVLVGMVVSDVGQTVVVRVSLVLLLQRGGKATAVVTVPEDGVQVTSLLWFVGGWLQRRQALRAALRLLLLLLLLQLLLMLMLLLLVLLSSLGQRDGSARRGCCG